MEHDDIRHMLSEYLDNSVSAGEKTEIEEHLKVCRECKNALEELRKTIEHIRTVEEIDPPSWMKQKIMASVRAEAEENRSFFRRFFRPLPLRLPIQALAVIFVAVTGFYIYQAIGPASRPSEGPASGSAVREEASPPAAAQNTPANAEQKNVRPRQVPQTPAYKSLDMKLEYERPSAPVPEGKVAAPASAEHAEQPAHSAQEDASGKKDSALQAGAPAMMKEQNAAATKSAERAQTLSNRDESAVAEESSASPADRLERAIRERYPDDRPKLVVTYELIGSHKVKRAEERFNDHGERHGLQREFYASGRVKTEARYGNGKLEWYREFQPDGVKKIGQSDYDWFWLKK
jgi:hypothetical protein